eukprot:scaffold61668_cov69-Attheya_sp.AAC.3
MTFHEHTKYQTRTIQYIPIASFKVVLKLHAGVGAITWVMSKYVHPSRPIREQSANGAKNHKLEGGVLVEEENKVVQWNFSKPCVFPRRVIYQTGTISSSHRLFQEAAEASCRHQCHHLGDVEVCSPKYNHRIREQSTNSRVKNHQLEGDVLVEEDEKKVARRNTERVGTFGVVGNWLQLRSSGENKQKKKWGISPTWNQRMLGGRGDLIWAQLLFLVPFRRSSPSVGAITRLNKLKTFDRNIKNSDAPTLSTVKVGRAVSANARWTSFYAPHVS